MGLFSPAVTTLLAVTVLYLQPKFQDASTFHLDNIQQPLADPSTSRACASIPSELLRFSSPTSAVWVNVFLILSLIISLTSGCALVATLFRQWAPQNIVSTQQPGSGPHERRPRVREFFDSIDKCHVSWIFEALSRLHYNIRELIVIVNPQATEAATGTEHRGRKKCVERAAGPNNRRKRGTHTRHRRKNSTKMHGKEDKVIDAEQANEEGRKE